ncbi:MAG: hypothetical protein P4L22_00485 [Candidatus Babeliales bacterium]|nr:hypothetical protein [Candidatus Babeliales bacterium]
MPKFDSLRSLSINGLILFFLLNITLSTNALKIDRVILSTDANPDYIQFWPIVSKVWQDYIGIKPTLALIADKSVYIDESIGDVIRFEPIPGVKTSLHAQVIRFLLPAYFEDEVCIISDIDMIPLNKNYFFDSVRNVQDDCFVTYRNYFYPDTTTIYPMCYNAAKGKVFKEIFKISNINDITSIVQNWSALNLGWSTDEILLLKYLRNWKDTKTRCVHLDQEITGRVDRGNNLSCDLNLIKSGGYIDAHCPRPFNMYKKEIYNILNALIPDFAPGTHKTSLRKADLVIFSFDRPLQLYTLLESIEKYVSNLGEINIIYRASDNEFAKAYDQIKTMYQHINFIKQGDQPHRDFKNLVLKYSFETPHDYILYAVDDIIIKDKIDIAECIGGLEKNNAYAFLLRLGKNINACYSLNTQTPAPEMQLVDEHIFNFKFNISKGDWAYPNNLDMTLYKKSDIKYSIINTPMTSPNTFEGNWALTANLNKTGLIFENSKIVNLPLNICNELPDENRNMKLYSTYELLEKFNQNLKIDITKFYKINNNSPHWEMEPEFKIR